MNKDLRRTLLLKSILFWFSIIVVCIDSNSASAVKLGQNGKGQVLIFPFFTAQNGWDTYIDLTLDGSSGATVPTILKIYVRDGVDGEIVNGFNVYTGFDRNSDGGAWNWRASISQNESDETILRIAEGPCTVSNERIGGSEGHEFLLEAGLGIIEVYAISKGLEFGVDEELMDCQNAVDRWNPLGTWRDDPNEGLVENNFNHQISGDATLINVFDGVSVSYKATALQNFADEIPHTAPFAIGGFVGASPTLADADPVAILKNGTEIIPQSGEGIDAVAAVLADLKSDGTLTNQVVTAPEIGARTDWVLTYPLAGYINDKPFLVEIDGEEKACDTFGLHPGENDFDDPPGEATHPVVQSGWSAASWILTSWGSGNWVGGFDHDFSPDPPWDVEAVLCNAVNVVSFTQGSSIFLNIESPQLYKIGPSHLADPGSSTLQWEPVASSAIIAFRVTTFMNGTLNGGNTLANYGVLRAHE